MIPFLDRARDLHRRVPVIDTHSHFLLHAHYAGHDFSRRTPPLWPWNPLRSRLDLPRLFAGGVSGSTCTAYVPHPPYLLDGWAPILRMLDAFDALVTDNADQVVQAETAAQIRDAHAAGKLAAIAAVEGGGVIGKDVSRVAVLRERGVRWLTLTHFVANPICDGHLGPRLHGGGLSSFGMEVVLECVRQGIVVCLAHAAERAYYQVVDALGNLGKPPVVTHACLRFGRSSERYISDGQIRDLAAAGGALGVLMCPWFLKPHRIRMALDEAVDVYCHIANLVGPEHLMIGTDLNAGIWLPQPMRDVSDFPLLTARLLARGFSENEVIGILGGNALRILEAWEN